MQLYKVVLNNPDTVEPCQNFNGYLGHDNNLCLYSRSEAIKKARVFNGKVEKHGKDYTTSIISIVRLSNFELSENIRKELVDREVYIDADENFNDPIYYGDVFAAIAGELAETINPRNQPETIEELVVLDNICANYEYVMIMGD